MNNPIMLNPSGWEDFPDVPIDKLTMTSSKESEASGRKWAQPHEHIGLLSDNECYRLCTIDYCGNEHHDSVLDRLLRQARQALRSLSPAVRSRGFISLTSSSNLPSPIAQQSRTFFLVQYGQSNPRTDQEQQSVCRFYQSFTETVGECCHASSSSSISLASQWHQQSSWARGTKSKPKRGRIRLPERANTRLCMLARASSRSSQVSTLLSTPRSGIGFRSSAPPIGYSGT